MTDKNQKEESSWKLRVMSHEDQEGEFFSIQDVYHVEGIPETFTDNYQIQGDSVEELVEILEEAIEGVKMAVVKESHLDIQGQEDYDDDADDADILEPCREQMDEFAKIVKETPNNMELGKVIRRMFNSDTVEKNEEQLELFSE